MRVSRSWSRLPQLTPMRTGLRCRQAVSIIAANCGSRLLPRPTLPGLMRYLSSASAQAGCAASSLWPLKWKSPTSGTSQPSERSRSRMCGHGRRRLVGIDRHAHELRARLGELAHLARRRLDVRRVGIGHRLDDDRRAAADSDGADAYRDRAAARGGHFAFCAAIQSSTVRSRMSSGTAPVASTASWNARMSNWSPSAASARSRSSRNFSWPIL